jgi:hypothetical protein
VIIDSTYAISFIVSWAGWSILERWSGRVSKADGCRNSIGSFIESSFCFLLPFRPSEEKQEGDDEDGDGDDNDEEEDESTHAVNFCLLESCLTTMLLVFIAPLF